MLIYTTDNRAICMSSSKQRHCVTLPLDTLNFTSGMNAPLSDISYHRAEEACLWKSLLLLRNDRSWIWTACRSAILPVGGLQRPCRNHFPHSGSWQVQRGSAYICRDQRKHVFHNMGPLIFNCLHQTHHFTISNISFINITDSPSFCYLFLSFVLSVI